MLSGGGSNHRGDKLKMATEFMSLRLKRLMDCFSRRKKLKEVSDSPELLTVVALKYFKEDLES
jgi:hypothetical protein